MTVFVTLANGRVGSELIRQLLADGVTVRGGVRDIRKAQHILSDAELVSFDYDDPTTFETAFIGTESLFLASPHEDFPNEQIYAAADAARAVGVRRVVLLSALGVDQMGGTPARQLEQYVEQNWSERTILRPNSFMQNYATMFVSSILHDGTIVEAAGDATTAFIDIRDIAAVAVQALTTDAHHGKGYMLTGGKAYHRDEVAQAIAAATGRSIRYMALNDAAFHEALVQQGMPDAYAHKLVELYVMTRSPLYNGVVSEHVRQVLGRAPITFEQFAHDYRAAWMPN